MILRERQKVFVNKSINALNTRRNTLGIAPTGAGKTVCLSAIVGGLTGSSLIIQHRDELVEQNERTFKKINPKTRTSFVTADYKRWEPSGATFAMIQTLTRDKNLQSMPWIDNIAVDEAHHIVADSYLRVIDHAVKINPDVKILGVTATPGRGDNRKLRTVFDNVADQITMTELIRDGHLVPPRCFVIELGLKKQLSKVAKLADEFNMSQVEEIMNKKVVNEKVVEKWLEMCENRKTVAFCSTIAHAMDMRDEFRRYGVDAEIIHGGTKDHEREDVLRRYEQGKFKVLLNVMVLTEGWDDQTTSCVLLLRMCSHLSTLIQMIGRGLRIVDPERYPGVVKNDCMVLDFGYSLHTHRTLEQTINIEGQVGPKCCPQCQANVPACVIECAICGYEWPIEEFEQVEKVEVDTGEDDDELEPLVDFIMTEMELFKKSPFKWESFFDDLVVVANGLDAWAAVINYKGNWHAVGGNSKDGMTNIAVSHDRLLALAKADDYMREHGDDDAANKSKRWVNLKPSDKQLEFLGVPPMGAIGISRYRASCMITWKKMERPIQNRLQRAA